MPRNYDEVSRAIFGALGGLTNIEALTHCMTRLRFVVKDQTQVDLARLKAIDGVMGVVHNDSQCQVIIGNNVSQAYQAVMQLGSPGGGASAPVKRKLTLKGIGTGVLDTLVGTMSPLIPAIVGLASHSMASPGLFTSVQFFDPANPMSIVWVAAVIVLSFVLTLILGFDDIPETEQATAAAAAPSSAPVTERTNAINAN
ncbi:hypothetical protein FD733_19060 [Pantoea sp. Eser]|nr:hypothetical protein [Pantoea sp. Eser]